MTTAILLRAAVTAGILLTSWSLYWLVNQIIVFRARKKHRGLEALRPGVLAILYFTTPTCAPCKTVQRPALQRLQNEFGDDQLQVIEIDAAAQPELADYWGVLSVPTTFIIDTKGRPRRVNHGVTRAEKLLQQLTAVAADTRQQQIPILKLAGTQTANHKG